MTTRERIITSALGTFIFVVVAGFLYFVFYARPMASVQDSIDMAQKEIDKKQGTLDAELARNKTVYRTSPRLEKWQELSLPTAKDAKEAHPFQVRIQGDFQHLLESELVKAGFPPGGITAAELPKKTQQQGNRGLSAQKTVPYTPMKYTVSTKGTYETVLKAMENLYRLPVLHEIKSFTLEREGESSRGSSATPSKDLKVTFVIEALQVEGAEMRETVQPKTTTSVATLASTQREYQKTLLHHDIFFGTPPKPKEVAVRIKPERIGEAPVLVVRVEPTPETPKPKVEDIAYVLGVIKLTTIAHTGSRWEAFYYDQGTGGYDRMLNMRLNRFEFKDKYKNVLISGEVINISTTRGIYFRADDKHVYRWGLNESLGQVLQQPLAVVAETKTAMLLKGMEGVEGLAVMSVGDSWEPYPPRPASDLTLHLGLASHLAAPLKVNDGVTVASRNALVAEKIARRPIVEEKKPEEKPVEEKKPAEGEKTEEKDTKPGEEQ